MAAFIILFLERNENFIHFFSFLTRLYQSVWRKLTTSQSTSLSKYVIYLSPPMLRPFLPPFSLHLLSKTLQSRPATCFHDEILITHTLMPLSLPLQHHARRDVPLSAGGKRKLLRLLQGRDRKITFKMSNIPPESK